MPTLYNILKALCIFLIGGIIMSASSPPLIETPQVDRETAKAIIKKETISVPLNSIKYVICYDSEFNQFAGTAWLVAPNTYATAYHVVENKFCMLDGEPIEIIEHEPQLDFSTFKANSGDQVPFKFSCRDFQSKEVYYAFGFPSPQMVVTRLIAMDRKVDPQSALSGGKSSFADMRILSGVILKGMSGGPIVDRTGTVIGINSATAQPMPIGLSRSLSETHLCRSSKS